MGAGAGDGAPGAMGPGIEERDSMTKSGQRRTPLQAIRAQCLHCNGGNDSEVRRCDGDGREPGFHECPFHPYRLGKGRASVRTIRRFCLQCMGGSTECVRECDDEDCFCYPYRMGTNPAFKGKVRGASLMSSRQGEVGGHIQGQIFNESPPLVGREGRRSDNILFNG